MLYFFNKIVHFINKPNVDLSHGLHFYIIEIVSLFLFHLSRTLIETIPTQRRLLWLKSAGSRFITIFNPSEDFLWIH